MPKVGMEPVRKAQLIQATIATIHERGLVEATVKNISAKAGVSAGIIHHYFGGKDELLRATMAFLVEDLTTKMAQSMAVQPTLGQKLEALVDTCISDHLMEPDVVAAWLALWSLMPSDAHIRQSQTDYCRRLNTILSDALGDHLIPETASGFVEGMAAMIDGLWIRTVYNDAPMEAAQARSIIRQFSLAFLKKPSNYNA